MSDLRDVMPLAGLQDCGCGEGTARATPQPVANRPGLSAIAYRAGTHGTFLKSMLAALSQSGQPALAGLGTRDADDPSIALLDGWAVIADVLAFYNERIANEHYLRTATERSSVLELARLIGYRARPGVAASTWLAFTLDDAKGAPRAVQLDSGVQVQSVPGPDETPQTFETVEAIDARAEWNALRARTRRKVIPTYGSRHVVLQGTGTGLKPGDAVLFIGQEQLARPQDERWDFRRVTAVEKDLVHDLTRVTWEEGLGWSLFSRKVLPAAENLKVYAFRTRASLFGFNAADWRLMSDAVRLQFDPNKANNTSEWTGLQISLIDATPATVHLDAPYPQVVEGSWVVLSRPHYQEVYLVDKAFEDARKGFGLTSKTTRLLLKGENLKAKFDKAVRETVVFCQSEELPLAEEPICEPVEGDTVTLDQRVDGLLKDRTVLLTGKRPRLRVSDSVTKLPLQGTTAQLIPGDEVVQLGPRALSGLRFRYPVRDAARREGVLSARPRDLLPITPLESQDTLTELLTLAEDATVVEGTLTRLRFTAALANVYDAESVRIFANVAAATHGETTSDVLGAGDASLAHQRFSLKQTPLTYLASTTGPDPTSTLEVRVDGVLWNETSTLFGRTPRERVYVTFTDDDGKTSVQFGDGSNGARLPTGPENVAARYRKGIGRAGQVKAEQLSLLKKRPLGVKSVVNPLPARGAADRQPLASAREGAPVTVLTLGRIVSLRDYEDFARSVEGIAKALATWTWNGQERGVLVTVAGLDGDAVPPNETLATSLVAAMLASGDPRVPVQVASYRPASFRLAAALRVDAAYVATDVFAAAQAALKADFTFAARSFGQAVTLSEVVATLQAVRGVVGVRLDELYRVEVGRDLKTLLRAEVPQPGTDARTVRGAEILVLDGTAPPTITEWTP
jgi:hypothetical protein